MASLPQVFQRQANAWTARISRRPAAAVAIGCCVVAAGAVGVALLLRARRGGQAAELSQALHRAVVSGDFPATARLCAELLSTGAHVDPGELIAAAKRGDAALLTLLLRYVPIQARDGKGATALLAACAVGKPATAALLLEKGADASACDASGLGAAHYAASAGHLEILKLLAKVAGFAQLDAPRISDGLTPLHLAVTSNQTDVVSFLISCGASVNAATNEGITPLMTAAHRNRGACVQLLASAGADPGLVASGGRTALSIAARRGALEACATLLAAGAAPHGHSDDAPLACAAQKGHVEVMRMLAGAGADVNACELGGRPLLVVACEGFAKPDGAAAPSSGAAAADGESAPRSSSEPPAPCRLIVRPEVVQALLDMGADPDALPSAEAAGLPSAEAAGLPSAEAAAGAVVMASGRRSARDVIIASGDRALLAALQAPRAPPVAGSSAPGPGARKRQSRCQDPEPNPRSP